MKSAFDYINSALANLDRGVRNLNIAASEIHGMMAELHREIQQDIMNGDDFELGDDNMAEMQEELQAVDAARIEIIITRRRLVEVFNSHHIPINGDPWEEHYENDPKGL